MSDEYFTTLTLPIKFINIPEGYLITDLSSKELSISLKGHGWMLAQITFGRDPVFEIDAKNQIGDQSVLIRNYISQNSWLTSSLQITEISPNILSFKIEKEYYKIVPVSPELEIIPKSGFGLVREVTLDPDSVKLVGPEKILKRIESVATEFGHYVAVDSPIDEEIGLVRINDILISPDKVRLKIEIQKIADKSVENVLVKTVNVPRGRKLEIFPTGVQVVLRGGINELASVKNSDIEAFVDFKQALTDTLGVIQPTVIVPKYLEVLSVKPNKLKYFIKNY